MGFSLRKFARGFSESMAETGRAQIKANLIEQRERRLAQQRAEERAEDREFQLQRDKENRAFQEEQNQLTREQQGERIDMEERRLKLTEEKTALDSLLAQRAAANDDRMTELNARERGLQIELLEGKIDTQQKRQELQQKIAEVEDGEVRRRLVNMLLINMGKDPYKKDYDLREVGDDISGKRTVIFENGQPMTEVSAGRDGVVVRDVQRGSSSPPPASTAQEAIDAMKGMNKEERRSYFMTLPPNIQSQVRNQLQR